MQQEPKRRRHRVARKVALEKEELGSVEVRRSEIGTDR